MLAASVFNLIYPGIKDGGFTIVAAGMLAGALIFGLASRRIAHHDFTISGVSGAGGNRIALVLGTMFLHSFPEGLAIGVAFGSGDASLGIIIAIAIAIHNIPEGIAVSLPLRAEGVGGWKCVGWSIFSSLPQPIAVIPAYLAVVAFRPILPFSFGFAAGAMFFSRLQRDDPGEPRQRCAAANERVGSNGRFHHDDAHPERVRYVILSNTSLLTFSLN